MAIGTMQEALLREYGEGWRAGAKDTLRLLVGEPVHGAAAFEGALPPDLESWARAALAKLEDPAPLENALRVVRS